MQRNIHIYILIMAAVTYLIRTLPLTLIRREIKNPLVRSFLYYVPYVTLAVMIFPGVLTDTNTYVSGLLGFGTAVWLAWQGKSLIKVAIGMCFVVFVAELMLVG
ncbi:MAG: AzlD domain-containing protein [Firmicutes bacterium]|nr:AzlD domain-containing protein [Bacillota bacterium]